MTPGELSAGRRPDGDPGRSSRTPKAQPGRGSLAGNDVATAIAVATLAPGGTVAVGGALFMDEMQHYRAGIGCMLESDRATGEVYISVIVKGGAAAESGLAEGDYILQVDEHRIVPGTSLDTVSSYIRGPVNSVVTLVGCACVCCYAPCETQTLTCAAQLVRHRYHSDPEVYRIERAPVPGQGTEMLGALFQSRGPRKEFREPTLQDKLDKLHTLHARGNLSDRELEAARQRLLSGQDTSLQHAQATHGLSSMFSALASDLGGFAQMFEDPEVVKRKKMLQHQHGHQGPRVQPPNLSARSPEASVPGKFHHLLTQVTAPDHVDQQTKRQLPQAPCVLGD